MRTRRLSGTARAMVVLVGMSMQALSAVAHMAGPDDGGDPAAEGPVHQHLTWQAYRFYDSQFPGSELGAYIGDWTDYGSLHHRSNGDDNDVIEGSFDEDVGLIFHGDIYPQNPFGQTFPYFRHFVAGGDGDEIYDGWAWYESAVTQAEQYWFGYVLAGYSSQKARSYYYLGHVAHLLEDMTVPAHVHNDDHVVRDAYEYTMGEHHNYLLWGHASGYRAAPAGQIALPADLTGHFRLTIDYTEEYDSDDADGDDEAGIPNVGRHRPDLVSRSGGFSGDGEVLNAGSSNEITLLGDDLMPFAMEQVAGLFRLFYGGVDGTAPEAELYGFSGDEQAPTVASRSFLAHGRAEDPESGAGSYITTWRKEGAEWVDQTLWGPCGGGGDVWQEVALPASGLYRIQLVAGNGAGVSQQTPHGYFEVPLLVGDANDDGAVDGGDYTLWADHYLLCGMTWSDGDFTGNGCVDGADYTLWADHYLSGCGAGAIPEPAALCLLPVAGLALIRRRRAVGE